MAVLFSAFKLILQEKIKQNNDMTYRKYHVNTICKVHWWQMLHYKLQHNGMLCSFLWTSPVSHWQKEVLPKADLRHPGWVSPLNQPLEVTRERGHSCENSKLT